MKTVTVYSTEYCPYCVRAKNLLKSKNIPFQDIDLTNNQVKRDELQAKTGWMTVPMIFIGEEFIGGCDDLHELDASGKLPDKLK